MQNEQELFFNRQREAVKEYNKRSRTYDAQTVDKMRAIWVADILKAKDIIHSNSERKIKNPMISTTRNGYYLSIGYGKKNKTLNNPDERGLRRIFISNEEGSKRLLDYLVDIIIFINCGGYDEILGEKLNSYNETPTPAKAA